MFNTKYGNRIAQMQREAAARFRNFDGIPGQRRFRGADGAAAGAAVQEALDTNDRTWTITVTNGSSTVGVTAILFGSNYDLTDSKNTAAGVTVTVAESSHLQVKTELLSQPVRILGLKMTAVSATQFSNGLKLYDVNSTGAEYSTPWQPLNYRSAQNQISTQIDAPSFELLVKPSTRIEFTINKSETVTFIFTIVAKGSLANILKNSAVVNSTSTPAPTGLPQIDMPRGL
jgi:hypothetical protein